MTATTMTVPISAPRQDASGFTRDRALWGAIMLAPYVLVFVVMVVYPVAYGLWIGLNWQSYRQLFADPIFLRTIVNTIVFLFVAVNLKFLIALWLSGFFVAQRAWVRIVLVLFILPWAVPSIPTILSFRVMLNPETGMLNSQLFQWFGIVEGPGWLTDPTLAFASSVMVHIWKSLPFWTLILVTGRLAISQDLYEAASVDGASPWQQFRFITWPSLATLYVTSTMLSMIWTLGDFNSVYLLTGGGPGDLNHVLATLGIRYMRNNNLDLGIASIIVAMPLILPMVFVMVKRLSKGRVMRRYLDEGKLILIAIPVLLWTLLPIYHLFVLSISSQESMLAGKLWPEKPTLQNFSIVFNQQHYYLGNFWRQMFNSFFIAIVTGLLTLFVATFAAFAISRLKVAGGRTIMNLALATYLIPAAFLAIPMYKAMGSYGLLNTQTALILAMVALASPYAIWVLKQASDKLPKELDEAAIMDGATSLQLFRLVYLPLMKPSMVVIGIYALLLAWNEYLYAFLLLSSERAVPLAVGLGLFLSADDAPWNLLMAAGLLYAIPPAVIYYGFRKNMVGGLTAGSVKS